MQNRKEFMEKVILEAGALIRLRINEDMSIEEKENNRSDLVTSVDLEVERFLVDKISKEYPNDSFLTEENTVDLNEKDNVWVIDPIDGTMNFIYHLRDFAISVALYVKGEGRLGFVYDVMADELIIGEKGKGVTLNNEAVPPITPEILEQSIFDISLKSIRSLKRNEIADFYDITADVLTHRNIGSAALRTAHIGLNRNHIYISARLSFWDIAAAIIILEELGGYHNFIDREVKFNSESFRFMAANNLDLYNEVIDKYFLNR